MLEVFNGYYGDFMDGNHKLTRECVEEVVDGYETCSSDNIDGYCNIHSFCYAEMKRFNDEFIENKHLHEFNDFSDDGHALFGFEFYNRDDYK